MLVHVISGVTVWLDPAVALAVVGIIGAIVSPKTRP